MNRHVSTSEPKGKPTVATSTTRTNKTSIVTKRITGVAAALGASAAMALGVAAPANAATPGTPPPAPTTTAAAPVTPAAQAAQAAAAAQQAAAAVPTSAQLMPEGAPTHGQAAFTPTATQLANAKAIVKAGQEMKLPPRAWVIAVATSMQESKLQNLGNLGSANDHDSLGLFQQRPSSGWGTPSECTNPDHAAKAFLSALEQVPNYQNLPLTVAAQKVQVSAYPTAYAKWEAAAAAVVSQAV